jgi:hypothetical protein
MKSESIQPSLLHSGLDPAPHISGDIAGRRPVDHCAHQGIRPERVSSRPALGEPVRGKLAKSGIDASTGVDGVTRPGPSSAIGPGRWRSRLLDLPGRARVPQVKRPLRHHAARLSLSLHGHYAFVPKATMLLRVVGGEFPSWNSGTLPRGTLLD